MVAPMLASPRGRTDVTGPRWLHEFKWDGIRVLARVAGGRLALTTRNGNDVAAAWPEFAPLAGLLPDATTIDGEVVVLDDDLRPDFARVAARMHVRDERRIARLRATHPGQLMAFDVLEVAGRTVVDLPLDERRSLLTRILADIEGPWAVSPAVDDLATIEAVVEARDLEGVVSKVRDSRYEPGTRSSTWRKWRRVRETDAVVVGHKGVRGATSGPVASLALARWDPVRRSWVSLGAVGSGLGDAEGARLREVFESAGAPAPEVLADLPVPDGYTPVVPTVVVRVRYLETTPVGHLRHPVYRGVRADVAASPVTERP